MFTLLFPLSSLANTIVLHIYIYILCTWTFLNGELRQPRQICTFIRLPSTIISKSHVSRFYRIYSSISTCVAVHFLNCSSFIHNVLELNRYLFSQLEKFRCFLFLNRIIFLTRVNGSNPPFGGIEKTRSLPYRSGKIDNNPNSLLIASWQKSIAESRCQVDCQILKTRIVDGNL